MVVFCLTMRRLLCGFPVSHSRCNFPVLSMYLQALSFKHSSLKYCFHSVDIDCLNRQPIASGSLSSAIPGKPQG